ncbi:MAG: hypothetical protein KatS3mg057_2984 [Herpetosiphonaceae bacterium]|nr:MAG: hypothetical protein KatS3mg057_2984 [Herpetosiphonaceae bacterium]
MTDLRFNVAQFLREHVGARRQYDFDEPALPLSDELLLAPLRGHAKFTRTKNGVLVAAQAEGKVRQVCGRCLIEYDEQIRAEFEEEFFSTVHVTLGTPLPKPEENDVFLIDENHLLDLGEAIREYALLALPIAPVCSDICQGLCPLCGTNRNENPCECVDQTVDERMAILKRLLNQD